MTYLSEALPQPEIRDDKLGEIRELRSDAEFLSGVLRGLDARRRGDRIHWDDVKAEYKED